MKKYTETWNYDLNKMPKIGEKIIIDFGNGVGTNKKYPYLVEEITKSKRGDFVVYKVEGRQLKADGSFRNKWFELFFKDVTMVNKCKCCDKTSEYHINKKVYYESGEYGRHYNWCELSEYFGDDWFHIGEEYLDIKHDGYYCKKHFEESVNTSPFNIK